jgi:hypothetical protein
MILAVLQSAHAEDLWDDCKPDCCGTGVQSVTKLMCLLGTCGQMHFAIVKECLQCWGLSLCTSQCVVMGFPFCTSVVGTCVSISTVFSKLAQRALQVVGALYMQIDRWVVIMAEVRKISWLLLLWVWRLVSCSSAQASHLLFCSVVLEVLLCPMPVIAR